MSPQDPWVQVSEVLRLIRTGEAQTRPEIADATRLGRNVVTLRIQAAQELGLVRPSGDQRSRGGRAAEVWELSGCAGTIAVGMVAENHLRVALADLRLQVIEDRRIPWDRLGEQEATCERIAEEMDALLAVHPTPQLWGVGLGVLAPVDFDSGRNADPVTAATASPRWPRGFDFRAWFVQRMQVPVWVDSVSNLMALGASVEADAPDDLIAVRMEQGVGSGIVSRGALHRGADWIAGEINHVTVKEDPERICLCGRAGCLDSFAGSWAIELDASKAISQGRVTSLSKISSRPLTADDVVAAAESGDIVSVEIVLRAAEAVGKALATVVTWFNPRRVVIGGNSLASSAMFRGAMNRALSTHALGASLDHLEIKVGDPQRNEELIGAFEMVRDALLSPRYLAVWGPNSSPRATPELLVGTPRT